MAANLLLGLIKAVKINRERGVSMIEHLKIISPGPLPRAQAPMSRYIIHPNAFKIYFLVIVIYL